MVTLLRKFEELGCVSLEARNHLAVCRSVVRRVTLSVTDTLSFCSAEGDTVCNGHAVVRWQMTGELVRNSGAVSIDWGGGHLISLASPRPYLRCDGTRLIKCNYIMP